LNFAGRGGTYVDRSTEFYVYKVNGESMTKNRVLLSRNADNVETTSPSQDCDAKSGTAYVGSYLPNDYGLYDVIGNVIEYTSERFWRPRMVMTGYTITGNITRSFSMMKPLEALRQIR
jgi:formylglycine-generating enzyme required for sulfatase activity